MLYVVLVGGRFPRARPQPPQRARPEGSSARAVPAGVAANFTSKCRDFGLIGQLLIILQYLFYLMEFQRVLPSLPRQ